MLMYYIRKHMPFPNISDKEGYFLVLTQSALSNKQRLIYIRFGKKLLHNKHIADCPLGFAVFVLPDKPYKYDIDCDKAHLHIWNNLIVSDDCWHEFRPDNH